MKNEKYDMYDKMQRSVITSEGTRSGKTTSIKALMLLYNSENIITRSAMETQDERDIRAITR